MALEKPKSPVLFVTVVAALVLVTALSSTMVGSSAQPAGRGCASPVYQPSGNESNVYQLAVPSTATICVTYSFSSPEDWNFTPGYGSITVTPEHFGYYGCVSDFNGTGMETPGCTSLTVTASPSGGFFPAGNVTVDYTITTSVGLQQGIYPLFLASCQSIALVVGPVPPGGPNNTAAFIYPNYMGSCIMSLHAPSNGQVVGVTNAAVDQVASNY